MNTDEQTLIDGLFSRLKQAEDPAQPRDAQAQARIEEHLRQQPAAPYYMAQAILVQEAALKRLDEQNKQLEAELKQARATAPAGNSGGGFLSGLFGGGTRTPEPQRPPAPGGGWRDPAPQPYAPAQPAPSAGSSFMGGAMKTAAGVAGGVLLAQGISSLFGHHSQPEEVVEVFHDAPGQQGGWNDQAAMSDTDYSSDDGGVFSDDDYV